MSILPPRPTHVNGTAPPAWDDTDDDVGPPDLAPIEAADDPHKLARSYLAERCQHADGITLRHWRDQWHRWTGSAYRILPDGELRADLTDHAKAQMDRANVEAQLAGERSGKGPPTARKVTARMVGDVAHALASMTILPGSRIEAPAWIGDPGPSPTDILACRNGLIHLPSLVSGRESLTPPTPRFFSLNSLDFNFDLDAPPPIAWLAFLAEIWPDDVESVATLQEWMGYLLTPDTRHQKILMLVGPKRSGKGTIARVIRALVGPDNVAGPTLSSLGTDFGLWPLIGKTVAMVQDARLGGKTDAAMVTERLLSISGEDALTVDRKFLPPVTIKLSARFMLMSNELPRLSDSSGALPGRMILLQMKNSWYGKEDTGLTERLLAELPSILLWSIEGWRRLRDRGHFVQPTASREMVSELGDLASPVGAFIKERCIIDRNCHVERDILFSAWVQWCKEEGRDHAGEKISFGRNLRAAVPSLRSAQMRDADGKKFRVHEGIGLK